MYKKLRTRNQIIQPLFHAQGELGEGGLARPFTDSGEITRRQQDAHQNQQRPACHAGGVEHEFTTGNGHKVGSAFDELPKL